MSPPLWLYLILLIAAGALTGLAFAIKGSPDWPSLFLNIAAGLVASVVILVVIDRRLRATDLQALQSFPSKTTQRLAWMVLPTRRTASRYLGNLLVALEPLVRSKVELASFQGLEDRARVGFVLLAEPGQGKTTWTQFVASSLGRQYLAGGGTGRVPILFPMASWRSDRSLAQALYTTFTSYAPCRRRVFNRILKSGHVMIILDGYDELWKRQIPFDEEVRQLRVQFPKVSLTLTSRSDKPTPDGFGEIVSLPGPTDEEREAIQRRKQR